MENYRMEFISGKVFNLNGDWWIPPSVCRGISTENPVKLIFDYERQKNGYFMGCPVPNAHTHAHDRNEMEKNEWK